MNLLLLHDRDTWESNELCVFSGDRHTYLRDKLHVGVGAKLKAGKMNGLCGTAEIVSVQATFTRVRVSFDTRPPQPIDCTLLIALPRPKIMRRIVRTAVVCGVKEILFFNSWRVEKSYWSSPLLAPGAVEETVWRSLEQAADTGMPHIGFERLLVPFLRGSGKHLARRGEAFIAHPSAGSVVSGRIIGHITLAIGPEGGFIPDEIELFRSFGFQPFSVGSRIYGVEQALPFLLGKFFG